MKAVHVSRMIAGKILGMIPTDAKLPVVHESEDGDVVLYWSDRLQSGLEVLAEIRIDGTDVGYTYLNNTNSFIPGKHVFMYALEEFPSDLREYLSKQ